MRSKTPRGGGGGGGGGGSRKSSKRQSADISPGLLGFHAHNNADLDAVSMLSTPASMVNIAISATAQHQSSSSSSNASAVSLHQSTSEDRDQLMEMTQAVYGSRSPRVTGKLNGNSSNILSIDEVAPFQQVKFFTLPHSTSCYLLTSKTFFFQLEHTN